MIITKERIRHNGVEYAVNAKIEDINEKDAERLVNLGVAFYLEVVQVPADDGGENKDPNQVDLTPEEAAEELDKLFDYAELKEAAKTVELEFAGNISKANLIALILEQNKAEEIFDLVEEDEE